MTEFSNQNLIIDRNSEYFSIFMSEVLWKGFDEYVEEQFLYRAYVCKSCVIGKKCDFCKCNISSTITDLKSCNKGKRFPDLMKPQEWEQFKNDHNLIFK